MHPRRRPRRGRLLIALVALVAATVVSTTLAAPPRAEAASTLLCKGFTACEKAGYSSFGYGPSNYKKMWWRMYAGHNCTNYVAYRMIQAGLPAERPWSGSGDARNWGVVFKSKVNQTPLVGSVAWWSSNHVAYVQQVVDADTIVISEDHYRGDFNWRRITRAGGGWPTGFIHLADESVAPTTPPAVTGTPKVDQVLSVAPGAWNRPGATYKYQWLSAGKAIAGATAPTYVPTAAQVGTSFAVKVTATKAGYKPGTATTPTTTPTEPGTLVPTGVPEVDGIPKVGAVLTGTVPAITPAPQNVTYAWFAAGKRIVGASTASLALQPEHLGTTIRFVATSTRAGYEELRTRSALTAPIGPEKLTVEKEPVLSGTPNLGSRLSVDPGVVSPAAGVRFQWFAGPEPIKRATAASYVPQVADLAKRIRVRITYARPGYTTIVRELQTSRPVRSLARISARSTAHKTVTVRLVAEGVPTVRGSVTLLAPNGSSRTVVLEQGKATFSRKWIRAGSRTYTISYLGSAKVEARTRTVTLVVR